MTSDLRTAALSARASGDHPTAMQLWRMLLDRAPHDAAVALELKHDTRAAGQYPDNDPRFRRAARHLPDTEWLQHYSNLYAFAADDLDAVDDRARTLLASAPDEVRLHAIRGDVARQRRDWAAAESAFRAAAALDPGEPQFIRQAEAARLYAGLARQPWAESGPATRIAIINLDRNPERMAEMARQFAGSHIPWARHAAVEGSRLPSVAVERLTGQAHAPRGTLGCLLSHLAAWEALLAGPDEALFVIEDDAIPLLDLPPRLGALPLPAGWDIVWVNDRMEPPSGPAAGFSAHPLASVVQAMHPDHNACGTDGYLISRAGALKLLAWTTEDGMASDIDWRLVAYGMTPYDVAAIPPGSHARHVLTPMVQAIPRPERLAAYTLYPALIRTVGVSSDREDQNRLHPSG